MLLRVDVLVIDKPTLKTKGIKFVVWGDHEVGFERDGVAGIQYRHKTDLSHMSGKAFNAVVS